MKKHLTSIKFGNLSRLLCLSFCLLLLSTNVKATELSGIYTIDANLAATTTNFKNIPSALSYLTGAGTRTDGGVNNTAPFGVSAPVIFNIRSGTYTGSFTIPAIPGASAMNTITFQSAVLHADSVKLERIGTVTDPVVILDSAGYINLKYLTLISGRGIELTRQASNNTIDNCKIQTTAIAVYATNFLGGNNTFSHSVLKGDDNAVFIRGVSDSLRSDSNIFSDNTMIATKTVSTCNLQYIQDFKIINNIIRGNSITTGNTNKGILINGSYRGLEIIGNKITVASEALSLTNVIANAPSPAYILNNVLICTSAGNGIINTTSSWQRFYYNSVRCSGVGMLVNYNASSTNNQWRNNVLTCGNSVVGNITNTGTNNTWNYNMYFRNTLSMIYFTGHANFNAWKTATGQDANSVMAGPNFMGSFDLHFKDGCNANQLGTPLAGITTDVEGNLRKNPPTKGAYEYSDTNSIAMQSIISPSGGGYGAGAHDVTVSVRNIGTNTVTSFNISYSLNNGTPVSQVWTGTLASCSTVSVTFTGSNQVTLTNPENTIKVYTHLPNGNNEFRPADDTLSGILYVALNGTYTIGHSGADFSSFNEATTALRDRGVAGPVVFRVASGTYDESFSISSVAGTSLTNSITFVSAANHTDSVVIENTAEASDIITLSSSHVSFKYMTIHANGGNAFQLSGTIAYDSIMYCKMTMVNRAINLNNTTGHKNVLSHNTITGASGIWLWGESETATNDSNIVSYNTINASAYGLDLRYTNKLTVENNKIIGAINGVYMINTDSGITRNNIISCNTIGLQHENSKGHRFYHNSILSTGGHGVSVNYDQPQFEGNEWKNNIMASYGTNSNAMYVAGASGLNTWDYNLYYAADTSADLITGYATLAAWQTATSHDTESVSAHPGFINDSNLHLTNGCIGRGIFLPSIPLDLDGITRSNPPMMGAYEYLLINNIGIDSIITPTASTISVPGAQDVIVRIKNKGQNTVTAFTISYTLNNGTPVSQPWSGTLNPCDTISVIFSGANQITLANTSEIAVYTQQPNAVSDTHKEDDTLKIILYAPFNGSYIIGTNPGAHFTTIGDALIMLDSLGMTGSVIFNMQDGVYNEQVVFPESIPGSSVTNKITFQSQSGHADSVTIAYDMSSPDFYVVKIGQASNITFKNVTFTVLGVNYFNAVLLNGTASYDTIINCKFNAPQSLSENSGSGLILGKQMTGMNNAFIKNTFNKGTAGICLEGSSSTRGNGITADSNTFLNNYTNGIHITNMNGVTIRNNTINSSTTFDNYTGIYLASSADEADISANKIKARVAGGNGIFLLSCQGIAGRSQMITNNSIIMIGLADIGGIRTEGGGYQEYYHNSVSVNAPNATITNSALSFDAADPGFKFKNNIFAYNGGGCAMRYQSGFNPSFVESNYNNLYTLGGTLITQPSYATLSDWQTATGADLNSISADPPFSNDTLLLQPTHVCAKGILTVTHDLQGNVRATPPVIGAYELAVASNDVLAIGSVLQPLAPFNTGIHTMKIAVQNIGATPLSSFDVTYRRNGIDTVTVLWTGSLPQCAIDTATFTGVTMNTKNDFILYTSHPADSNRTNDTLKTTLHSAFAGIYTIGGTSPSFNNFTEAVTAIKNGGMNGSVTFNVAAGITYPENPLILDRIPGKNLYSLTFQKSGVGTNPIISGRNGKATTDAVVSIINMDSVTFNGIDVRDDAANPGIPEKMEYGYYITSSTSPGSKYNTIKNCRITLSRPGGSITTGILQTGSSTGNHHNRYENVKITDAYNGIMLQSMIASFPDSNNIITSTGGDTTIIGGPNAGDIGGGANDSYGILLGNQRNIEVSNCIVRNATVTSAGGYAIGIYLSNTSNSTNYRGAIIKNNRIHGIRTTSNAALTNITANGGAVGMRIDVGTNAPATVFNNIIYDLSKANPATISNTILFLRGIAHNMSGNGSAKYFNNTVYISSGSAANVPSTAFWKGGSGTPEIRNNMFINVSPAQTGFAKHFAVYLNTTTAIQSSHNLLWSSGINGNVGYRTTDQPTILNWRTVTGQDTSSVYYLPKMNFSTYNVSTADSSSWAVNGRGIHVSTVTTDIMGNTRPANRAAGLPDIGANEITPDSAVPAPLAVAIPASPAPNTTQVFLSPIIPGDTVAAINWSLSVAAPASVQLRQYVGERPPFVPDTANNYMYSYIRVNMPGGATHNYNIDLPYKTEWLGKNTSDANLIIISRNPTGPAWWSPDANSSPVLSRKVLVSPTSAYSDDTVIFTGTDRTIPLPVKLFAISATLKKNDVFVKWTTVAETNSNYFEIERNRSSDKPEWERIGNLEAKGNSSSVNNYLLTDKDAVANNKQVTTIYYRLKIVDKDGRYEYSKTVSVNLNDQQRSAVTEVFPNPFNKELYIAVESGDPSSVKVVLMDIAGKIISDKTFETVIGNNILNVSEDQSLISGIYFLSVTEKNGMRTIHKVVKE